jgi:hypothetical protein
VPDMLLVSYREVQGRGGHHRKFPTMLQPCYAASALVRQGMT